METRRISAEDYAGCLLDFCERRLNRGLPRVMNVAFVSAYNSSHALENRLLSIFKPPRGGGRAAFGCSVIALSVLLAVAAASVRKPGDWSQDRLMLSTIVNLERLDAINRGY